MNESTLSPTFFPAARSPLLLSCPPLQTFLTHIAQRYNASIADVAVGASANTGAASSAGPQALAEHTIFLSAVEPVDDAALRLDRLLVPQTGYMGLSTAEFCRWGWPECCCRAGDRAPTLSDSPSHPHSRPLPRSCLVGCNFEGALLGVRDMCERWGGALQVGQGPARSCIARWPARTPVHSSVPPQSTS